MLALRQWQLIMLRVPPRRSGERVTEPSSEMSLPPVQLHVVMGWVLENRKRGLTGDWDAAVVKLS